MRRFSQQILTATLGALCFAAIVAAQARFYEFNGLHYFFPPSHQSGVMVNNGSGTLTFPSPIPTSHLATGIADNTKFVRGDGTWAVPPIGSDPLPVGMVVMFRSACPTGWTSLSGVGGVLENRFPRGAATYDDNVGAGFGADTHGHAAGTLAADGHAHGAGTLAVASHSHGAAGLAVDNHSHTVNPPNVTSTGHSVNHTHSFNVTVDTGAAAQLGVAGLKYGGDFSGHDHSVTVSGDTAGTSTGHTHDVNIGSFSSGGTAPGIAGSTAGATAGVTGSTASVGATISGSTANGANIPAHIKVVYCQKD